MTKVDFMEVSRELLETMLDAALSTARSFRGRHGELYALGQLESTANLIYIMICAQPKGGLGQLEVRCQSCALEAIERMEKISGGNYSQSSFKTG